MAETRRIELGVLPAGYDSTFADGADPLATMIAEGHARLDRMRADEERTRLAQIADQARAEATKRARIARRFRKALKMFARMRP
jgi:hypothetical protein